MLVILGTKRATACTVDTKGTDSSVCITKESLSERQEWYEIWFLWDKKKCPYI